MNQLGFDSMLFPEYCLMFFFFFKKKQLQVPHALLLESQQRNGPTGAGVTRSSGPCAIFNFHIVRISGAYVLQFGHAFK